MVRPKGTGFGTPMEMRSSKVRTPVRSNRSLPRHHSPHGSPQHPFRHWSGRGGTEARASAILRKARAHPATRSPRCSGGRPQCSRESAAVSRRREREEDTCSHPWEARRLTSLRESVQAELPVSPCPQVSGPFTRLGSDRAHPGEDRGAAGKRAGTRRPYPV